MRPQKITDTKPRGDPYGYREIHMALFPIQKRAEKSNRQNKRGERSSLRLMLSESEKEYQKRNNNNARSASDKSRQTSAKHSQKNIDKNITHDTLPHEA